MQNGVNWNNPYLLTLKLDEIISSEYASMKNLFSVQLDRVNSHEKEPLDAINDITVIYDVRDSIRDVVDSTSLEKYNDAFRFILRIKWSLWTLETLRFPIAFKRRRPYIPLTMFDLTFKRLALMRNWLIYSIQCIHSHLMTAIIQFMGAQLARKMEKVECLREIIELHESYIQMIHNHCFQKRNDESLQKGIEQLLHLAGILSAEWNNIDVSHTHVDVTDTGDGFDVTDAIKTVDEIEATYINCHGYIAEILSKEVYTKNRKECEFSDDFSRSSCCLNV